MNKRVSASAILRAMSVKGKHSQELREFCEELIANDSMNGIAIAYLDFDGAKLLKKLPPDAPKKLRDTLEAMVKVVNESRPTFNSLMRQLNKIAGY